MPKMRAPELAKRLKGHRIRLRIVYMSGYLEYNRGNDDLLEKGAAVRGRRLDYGNIEAKKAKSHSSRDMSHEKKSGT